MPPPIYFPLVPNTKTPIINKWSALTATPTYGWFKSVNRGLLLGERTGLTVVDVDVKDGGLEEWNALVEQHGEPKTLIQDTPSGGKHYIFTYSPFRRIIKLGGKGIDILSDSSYIVCEPSVINDKAYKFSGTFEDVTEMPTWLFQYINEKAAAPAPKLKPTNLLKAHISAPSKRKFNVREEDLREVLNKVPAIAWDNFDSWLKITYSLKSEGLFDVWDEYSRKSPRYNKSNNIQIWNGITNIAVDINYLKVVLGWDKNPFTPYRLFTPVTMQPSKAINTQFLTADLYEGHGTVAIASCTGTGKTTSFAKYALNDHVLSITPRIVLADAHAELFSKSKPDFLSYTKIAGYDPIAPFNFSVQVDSIIKYEYADIPHTIVYLDEAASLMSYIIQSDTLVRKRRAVFRKLNDIIKNAKQVVATDADMNDIVLNWLASLRGDVHYIKNEYQNCKGIPATKYTDKDHLITEMKRYAHENVPFTVCCDTKIDAEMINMELKKHMGKEQHEARVILHTSDCNTQIDNINELWKDKIVIYSPKIIYGLDFQPSSPQPVFAVAKGGTISPLNIAQQIARTRSISELKYHVADCKRMPKFNCADDVSVYYKTKFEEYEDLLGQMGCIDDNGEVKQEALFFRLLCMHENYMDVFSTHALRHFEDIIAKKGFSLALNDTIVNDNDRLKWGALKGEVKQAQKKMYLNYVKQTEGVKIPLDFAKTVDERLEIAKVKSVEQKVAYAPILYDNEFFRDHLNLSKMIMTTEKLNDASQTNSVEDYKSKYITSVWCKVKLIRNFEDRLEIGTLGIENIKPKEPFEMPDKELRLILKVFRLSCKTALHTKQDAIDLYYKCVNQISKDAFSKIERKSNGSRTYEYTLNKKLLKMHLSLLSNRSTDLETVDPELLYTVYDGEHPDDVREMIVNEERALRGDVKIDFESDDDF